MQLFIPTEIKTVLLQLQQAGFEAYIVGGCVRDMLMDKVPHDYDITTSALPGQVQQLFEKTYATGIAHGTVTVLINSIPTEVTTFRTESGYSDRRHPDGVQFVTNLEEDLARRDFTINAMAFDGHDTVIDCFGGQADLERHLLRTVGDPKLRFSEDALRIMRLFRFAAVLNFEIEQKTFEDAMNLSALLADISRERIAVELQKTVCGQNVAVTQPLIQSGALQFIGITDCKNLEPVSRLPQNAQLRFYAFLSLCACDVPTVLEHLKCSNSIKYYCKKLSELCTLKPPETAVEIKRALALAQDPEILFDFLEYQTTVRNLNLKNILAHTKQILEEKEPYLIKHLAIDGNDLALIGISGHAVGQILQQLCNFVVEHPELNKKSELITLAGKFARN